MNIYRKYISMPIITPSMTGHGPLIRVGIYDPDNKLHTCYALLDTGASHTSVDTQLLKDIKSNPIRVGGNRNATGPTEQVWWHQINIHVENENNIYGLAFNTPIIGLNISGETPPPAHKVLIGRDILALCTFIYDGKNNKYSLEW